MVSVEEAKDLLLKKVNPFPSQKVQIADAVNSVLSENIYSPVNLPLFRQSAMDGFAIKYIDRKKGLKIVAEVKAGDKKNVTFLKGEAVRIFTGAPVPDGADCIVIQEKTVIKNGLLFINDKNLKRLDNIRPVGSDIKKGDLALEKGSMLRPASIGFLAGIGIKKIPVYRKPRIAIIVTGSELKQRGKLSKGEIYESNSFSLRAALRKMQIEPEYVFSVKDEKRSISNTIRKAFSTVDFLIISGGISVGKYDLVKDILFEKGVEEVFYKVLQKPGKPLFVGTLNYSLIKKNTVNPKFVFALPGNPAASLVCFYEYVLPSLKKAMGYTRVFLPSKKLKLLGPPIKKSDRSLFLKGKITDKGVIALEGQGSYMMKSFAMADSIIYLPANANSKGISRNERKIAEVHLIDTIFTE